MKKKTFIPGKEKKLTATVTFSKEVAKSFHDIAYYEYEQDRLRNLCNLQKFKDNFSTSDKESVSEVINKYVDIFYKREQSIFNVLVHIRDRNIRAIKANRPLPMHDDLIQLVASPAILTVAYRSTRKNSGAMTPAYPFPLEMLNNLSPSQKAFAYTSFSLPDGMSYGLIQWIEASLLAGTYVWGCQSQNLDS